MIRPCPFAEVSLKCDSEEADAKVGRRGRLCGGNNAQRSDPLPVIPARVRVAYGRWCVCLLSRMQRKERQPVA